MIKPDSISVNVYMVDGKIRVFAQFGLPLSIDNDASGRVDENKRTAFSKAMEEAIAKWEIANV